MEKSTHIRRTIRFRRWSRKAYATFASIGRCVTIGFLRKNVADSSLGKQKKKETAGPTGNGMEVYRKRSAEEWETDAGEAMTFLLLFQQPMLCTDEQAGEAKRHILKKTATRGHGLPELWQPNQGTANIRSTVSPCSIYKYV